MERAEAWIALSLVKGIGESRLKGLVEAFGSPQKVFQSSLTSLMKRGNLSGPVAEEIAKFGNQSLIDKHLEMMEKHGVRLITFVDEDYPQNLRQLGFSPPMIYVRGEIRQEDALAVALVGSRKATVYGKLMAQKLASGLAQAGVTVVSGMARGIDTVAHRATLDSGGRTVAVLGSGLDVVYPPENRSLMEDIVGRGAVLSEFPMGTKPLAGNFPTRNRVISGLSLGVVAVEAGQNSGVFSTVRWAAEQGRDVFAVPGNVSSGLSVGTNILIKHGAKLTTDTADILEELNLEPPPPRSRQVPLLSQEEAIVFESLNSVPAHVDDVCQKVNLPISRTLSVLLSLEMRELISQLPGKLFVRKES
jgi:DNA processing protein